ncbi:MAG: lysine--tRNA ligase [Gammaproteobacteria bacterium]|nr:lysine--tRNA ligase [Gammaproteobacteria bacterium]
MNRNDDNEQVAQRREKLRQLRASGDAFPNDFRRDAHAAELLTSHADADTESLSENPVRAKLAGRLITKRIMGKAAFAHLRDESGDIQIYAQRDALPEGVYNEVFKKLDLGDIIGVDGTLFRTRTGELTVSVEQLRLLVKSLQPPPEKYHGLTDVEARYRQRYVDLLANQDSREVFRKRAKIVTGLRRFLDERGYLEIESPIMQMIPGGANARPFVTHHHALGVDLYLRVAQELAIKRCLVGGFERVYELNRNFRNEGLSTRHNPEFTMLEYNEAYKDFNDYMDLTEEEVSPLSRRQNDNPDLTDRFELFVAGRELANGFSELNDPDDQSDRFKEQAQAKAQGNEEAMFYDADYIHALEYGLPPNAGGGLGVDRFVMILTDSPSIRDVLLFPHMRPEAAD